MLNMKLYDSKSRTQRQRNSEESGGKQQKEMFLVHLEGGEADLSHSHIPLTRSVHN